jgi:hypothetical protein
MLVTSCGRTFRERSGGAILLYKAYPAIMYNRFINNGFTPGLTGGGTAAANGGAISHFSDDDVEFDEDRDHASQNNHSSRDIPEELNIQNNYFEGNSSGDGENFYSFGYEGSINVSHSVFENIDCESNSVNKFVLKSLEDEADYIQNEISGVCIESNSFYVSANVGNDNNVGTETSPLKTIGHALTLIKDDGNVTTINLNAGVYSPSSNDEKFPIVLPDNVHLIGDGSETTILDAEANANKEAATMIIKEVENIRVANLTLTGGYSEGYGCAGGGGLLVTAEDMYNTDVYDVVSVPVLLENLIIEDNYSYNGGGLSFFRVEGPIVNNVTVRLNSCYAFGGGIFSFVSTTTMTDVEITNNQSLGLWGYGLGHGGGLMLAGAKGTYTNMTITNNYAPTFGGGVWTDGSFSDWTMVNSTISGNTATSGGGVAMWDGPSPTLINVTIEDNSSVATWVSNGPGGGVWGNNVNPTLRYCTIRNNEADASGGGVNFYGGGYPKLTNCLIVGNSSTSVGGVSLDGVSATIIHCTISENTGGGLNASGGYAGIYNSIITNNNNGVNEVWGSVGIIYSNIEGGYAGEGNIDADPLFTDADNGDYTLQPDSPCLDAGTADLNGDGTEDITDYIGSAPDMGAFEANIPAPTGFQHFLQSSSVMLWWDPSTDENFQYFLLERSTDDLFAENVVSNYLTSSFYTDEDLEFNTEYFYRVSSYSTDWSEYSETISVMLENLDISHGNNLPISYKIHQNHPNPFNPVTTIRYDLPEDGLVKITIYDMMGRQISTLVSGQQTAGYNIVQWNATNTFGEAVSAGLYLYTIHAGEFTQTRKMVLLK